MELRMQKRRRGETNVPRPPGSIRRQAPFLVCVSNPAAFSGSGTIIVLELVDEDAARRAARIIARETGRCVTVRHADMTPIETIPAANTH
jgi:hypothetical protein